MLDLKKYLDRINFKGELCINHICLCELHKCHVMSVPFEAIDIQLNRKLKLDLTSLYNKVVLNRRGGFCYELNYLFHSLLLEIGFDSKMVSSRIYNKGSYGPEFDHMSIIIKLDEYYLVDVGYGDLFIEPLKLYSVNVQEDHFKLYKLEQLSDKEFLLLESLKDRNTFKKKYTFSLEPRTIDDFYSQCEYKQSSLDSHFVKNFICTIPTKMGRKTILNNDFKMRRKDKVIEKVIANKNDLNNILKEEFNISIDSK